MDLYRSTLLPQSSTTVQATLAGYTTGNTDFLDLLDAERTQLSIRAGYQEAFTRYLKTFAALERAAGKTLVEEVVASGE